MSALWKPANPAIVRSDIEALAHIRRSSSARRLILPGIGAPPAALNEPPSVQYIGNVVNAAPANPQSFNAVALGTPTGPRLVVLHVSASLATSITGVTFNSVAMQNVVSISGQAANGLFSIVDNSSTSANIVVSTGATAESIGIAVWAIFNLTNNASFGTASVDIGGGGGAAAVNVNTPDNGVMIAGASCRVASARTFTWTGGTERYDFTVRTNNSYMTGADQFLTAAQSPRAVSAQISLAALYTTAVSASWR